MAHGRIAEFSEGMNWSIWVERLKLYFEANSIASKDKQRAILLTNLDESTYEILRALLSPSLPLAVDFDEIVKTV